MRNNSKKLEDITKIEERVAQKVNITQDQQNKLNLKDYLVQSVQETIDAFEVYKKTEYQTLLKLQQQVLAPPVKEEPVEVVEKEEKESK